MYKYVLILFVAANSVQVRTTVNLSSTLRVSGGSIDDWPPSQFRGRGRPPSNEGERQKRSQPTSSHKRKWISLKKPVLPADPRPSNQFEMYHSNPFLGSEELYQPEVTVGKEEKENSFSPTPAPPRTTPSQVSRREEEISSVHLDTNFSPKGGLSPKDDGGDVCGRPILTNSLINNGEAVPRGAYPWLGALYRIRPSGFQYICSASLISNLHVVTAAHCVKNQINKPEEFLIILGKHNLQRWGRHTEGEKMIEPKSISVHPDYQDFSADADIAVLVLSESVQYSKYVLPLCIWREDTDLQDIVGMEGIVAGWGSDLNGVLMTDEPKQTNLPIVSQETCLRSSFEFLHITSNRTFCAGFRNGNGPCNGDSGSGFIMKRNGRWTLRGVVSLSLGDGSSRFCDLSRYLVFTDASKYLDWLISFIE